MLLRLEKYRITTLCKPDPDAIEKTKKQFNDTIRKLMREHQRFIGNVLVGYMGHGKERSIEFGNEKLSVCRLYWKIKGEKDVLDDFFDEWKEMDENPCHCFRVEPDYSLSDFMKLMALEEKEDDL